MTDIQEKIFNYVEWFKLKHHKMPTIEQIAEFVGKKPATTVLSLRAIGGFTEEQMMTEFQKRVKNLYLEGCEPPEISIEVSTSTSNVRRVLVNLKKRGLIELRKEDKQEGTPHLKRCVGYIKVTRGEYKGWRGYADITGIKVSKCRIYGDGKREEFVWLKNKEFEYIEGGM